MTELSSLLFNLITNRPPILPKPKLRIFSELLSKAVYIEETNKSVIFKTIAAV